MSRWTTEAAQWAAWTQEQAVATPTDVLDSFDAEVARRLGSSGFGANLEETVITTVDAMGATPPDPEDGDATLVRPSPDIAGTGAAFSDSAETLVHDRKDHDHDLEVSLEAPESGLEVGLDTTEPAASGAEPSGEHTVVAAPPQPPPEDPVDGLVLPSLTTLPETPIAAMTELEPAEGGTVVAPSPVAPSAQTVIAPAPTAPQSQPTAAAAAMEQTTPLPLPQEAPLAKTVVPTEAPEPVRSGGTLPPIADVDSPGSGQAMSSGVFRSIDIHDDDDDSGPVPAKQKVVIGIPQATPGEDTSEIDANDLVEETDVADVAEVMLEPGPEPEPPEVSAPVKEAAKPPPPKEGAKPPPPKDAPKPPPAPPVRAELSELPELPDPPAAKAPVEDRVEPHVAPTPSAPATGLTPKAPGWPEEVFDEHCAAMTRANHAKLAKAEVEFFIQSAGLQPGARVLDVGCGDGAHCLVLAQRGFGVTGLDISPAQIARAERAKDALGVGASFVKADMRDMPGGGPFDAILCVGTTFGYYDDEENRAVLRSLAGMLTPGGRLLLHVFNRDHIIGRLPSRAWWQGHGCLVLDEAQMNFFTNRLAVHRTLVFEDGRQFEHRIQIRGYNAHELGRMCVDAGLRVVEISGSRTTRGRFYGASSPDIWLLVEPKA
ncbi:MAG: methyltransferase domain-containing protein [Nannocystales bacterium]